MISLRPLLRSASVIFALTAATARTQTPDAHLATILAQMDTASEHFSNARADFQWDFYEAVVKDTTTQTGSIYFERKGSTLQMGAVVLGPDKKKDKVVAYKGGSLQLFDLAVDQIRIMNAGSNQAQYETFLTLGFGGSGKDLARAWNITDQGAETLTDNGKPVKCEKLDLISKDASVRNMFTHITIWVDPTRAVSLKQVFDTPSHDRRTATYSHIKLNASIDRGTFEIRKGPKTTIVR